MVLQQKGINMRKIILFALCLPSLVNAIPAKCPSPHSIIKEGFTEVIKLSGQLGVINHSFYDTDCKWQFAMPVHAKSKAEALKKAKLVIQSLKFVYGPIADGDQIWWCQYQTTVKDCPPVAKTN